MNSTVWSPTHLDFCAVKLFENNIHIYIFVYHGFIQFDLRNISSTKDNMFYLKTHY